MFLEARMRAYEDMPQRGGLLIQNRARVELAGKINEVVKGSAVAKIDPSTVTEHIEDVAQRAGLSSVSIARSALSQLEGIENSSLTPPELKERFIQARQDGNSVDIPLPVALALMNENPELSTFLSFNGEPSVNEAAQDADVKLAASQRLVSVRNANVELFNAEVAEVGRSVGE